MKIIAATAAVTLVGMWAGSTFRADAQVRSNDNNISMMDNCKPTDSAWPPPGCAQDPNHGDVTFAEFGALLTTTLGNQLIGHPSWRHQPSHITADHGKSIRVRNEGGREHTFTKVENFGGGTITALNVGLTRAPECPASPANLAIIPSGGQTEITGLATGLHKFQCCIHPWMRATIRVE